MFVPTIVAEKGEKWYGVDNRVLIKLPPIGESCSIRMAAHTSYRMTTYLIESYDLSSSRVEVRLKDHGSLSRSTKMINLKEIEAIEPEYSHYHHNDRASMLAKRW